jgi:hypothetical protein
MSFIEYETSIIREEKYRDIIHLQFTNFPNFLRGKGIIKQKGPYTFVSQFYPEYYNKVLYFLGEEKHRDNNIAKIPIKYWLPIKDMIDELNKELESKIIDL